MNKANLSFKVCGDKCLRERERERERESFVKSFWLHVVFMEDFIAV